MDPLLGILYVSSSRKKVHGLNLTILFDLHCGDSVRVQLDEICLACDESFTSSMNKLYRILHASPERVYMHGY